MIIDYDTEESEMFKRISIAAALITAVSTPVFAEDWDYITGTAFVEYMADVASNCKLEVKVYRDMAHESCIELREKANRNLEFLEWAGKLPNDDEANAFRAKTLGMLQQFANDMTYIGETMK